MSVGLESSSPKVLTELEVRDAQVKDLLIQVLASRTVEELASVHKREEIRGEIETRLEAILPAEGLDAVYFVNFVLQ